MKGGLDGLPLAGMRAGDGMGTWRPSGEDDEMDVESVGISGGARSGAGGLDSGHGMRLWRRQGPSSQMCFLS